MSKITTIAVKQQTRIIEVRRRDNSGWMIFTILRGPHSEQWQTAIKRDTSNGTPEFNAFLEGIAEAFTETPVALTATGTTLDGVTFYVIEVL